MRRTLGWMQREILDALDHAGHGADDAIVDIRPIREALARQHGGEDWDGRTTPAFAASFAGAVRSLIARGLLVAEDHTKGREYRSVRRVTKGDQNGERSSPRG